MHPAGPDEPNPRLLVDMERGMEIQGKHSYYHPIWYLKQLLPLRYAETRIDPTSGRAYARTYRMWFGRVFAVNEIPFTYGSRG